MAVEEKTTRKTEYVVLIREYRAGSTDSSIVSEQYKVVDTVPAITARQAISDVVKSEKLEEGTFVAVPSRSFQKTTIRSEQVSRIIFE